MKKMVSSKWQVVSGLNAFCKSYKFWPILILTVTFTSCSSDDSGGDGNETSSSSIAGTQSSSSDGNPSSSSIGECVGADNICPSSSSAHSSSSEVQSSSSLVSSSSVTLHSSSSVISGTGTGCSIDGYNTVTIGTQTWMAENYNCDVSGSRCYDDDPANCEKYGRLYDWATAMDFEETCNSESCSAQIEEQHKGICPEGWHIPTVAEWTTLVNYVGGGAGEKLKSTSGWNSDGNGTDEFGFAALPGGTLVVGFLGNFQNVGYSGYWWSASENDPVSAYRRDMDCHYDGAYHNNDVKVDFISIRCIKDN